MCVGETRKAASELSQPARTKSITQERGDGKRLTFNLIEPKPHREMREGEGERSGKGNTVPFNMVGLMQVLIRLPSGAGTQTTAPPGSGTLGDHESSVNRVAIC